MRTQEKRKEGVVAIHLPTGSLKPALGWSRYRDENPVPTSPLACDLATAPSRPVGRLAGVSH